GIATLEGEPDLCMKDSDGDGYGDTRPVRASVDKGTDCNDDSANINPDVDERCDGEDNDCDGLIDDEDIDPIDVSVWYPDDDGDGHGDFRRSALLACEAPPNYVADDSDCDDGDANTYPGAAQSEVNPACHRDSDDDGFGDANPTVADVVAGTDCDDGNVAVNSEASEVCDGFDNDCDGLVDDDDGDIDIDPTNLWYLDSDGDGFGDPDDELLACDKPSGRVQNDEDCDDGDINTFPGAAFWEKGTECVTDGDGDGFGDLNPKSGVTAGLDCNDGNGLIHPHATEVCDKDDVVDNDCDGLIDDEDSDLDASIGGQLWHFDVDNDGFGDPSYVKYACIQPLGYVEDGTDCDDGNQWTFPGAASSESKKKCLRDVDGDGYGDDNPPTGVRTGSDCDDEDASRNPGKTEVCDDGFDNDCNQMADDADPGLDLLTATTWYVDDDGDGFGDPNLDQPACVAPFAHVADNTDCNDGDGKTYPGAAWLDSQILCMTDADEDGFGDETPLVGIEIGTDCRDDDEDIHPTATEVCDDVDNNCDLEVDDDDDELDAITGDPWYPDVDLDGFGDDSGELWACEQPVSFVDLAGDCDDENEHTFPGAGFWESTTLCMRDMDGDLYGDDDPPNGVDAGTDCADDDIKRNPGETEVCDTGFDNDCDNLADDADGDLDLTSATVWWPDSDHDGFGDEAGPGVSACLAPIDHVDNADDCDPNDIFTHPGAADKEPNAPDQCRTDFDGDRYGEINVVGDVIPGTDCDDDDIFTFPNAGELENDPTLCLADADEDGYAEIDPDRDKGEPNGTDCDDGDGKAFPGAAALDVSSYRCMRDFDDDEYGDSSPDNSDVAAGNDCDDSDANRYPYTYYTIAVTADFPTISEAVAAACPGDRIEVGPGTYTENITTTMPLDIVGTHGSSQTVIASAAVANTVFLKGGIFEGFTIRGGENSYGAALAMGKVKDTTQVLRDLVITDNLATSMGVVYLQSASFEVEDVLVDNNINNSASGKGAGLYLSSVTLDADDLTVTNNDNYGTGGGIYALNSTIDIDRLVLSHNSAENSGGAYLYGVAGTWNTVEMVGNEAAIYGALRGDLVGKDNEDFILTDVFVSANEGQSPGVYLEAIVGTTARLVDAEVCKNIGDLTDGEGAVVLRDNSAAEVLRVYDNTTEAGIDIFVQKSFSSVSLSNVSVVGNSNHGVVADPSEDETLIITNTLIAYNAGTGLFDEEDTEDSIVLSNSVLWNNGINLENWGTNPIGSEGNEEMDPSLLTYSSNLDSQLWDLHLAEGSLLAGAGSALIFNSDGSNSDIGAFGGPEWDYSWYETVDGDVMYDGWETDHGLDPDSDDSEGDFDSDGLLNGAEFARGTWPDDDDTDGDGELDGAEVGNGTDPLDPTSN
ncbi:MAG: hypothetical protein HN348_11070, partial [Proteobacteria bacterium]|nr:hypothetical protein [Pseudomonadota bacterium]